MSDHLAALRLFVRVARTGSFSAAGRELDIPQSSASRAIAQLERDMGATLLLRSTRAVTLTDAGAAFLARLEPILAELENAEDAVRESDELHGVLRVGMGSSLAVREVIPRLPGFVDRHRSLKLDLLLVDQRQDLIPEGVDVALRLGVLGDSSATARRIRSWPRVLVASPGYLAKAGMPKHPTDLSAHDLIVGPMTSDMAWSFRRGGKKTSIRLDSRFRVDGNEGAIAAAVAGLGITMTTSGACRVETEKGSLVRVLPQWDLGSSDLHAVYVSGRGASRAAKVFTQYLIAALKDI
ncbi:LysR family transcriptional regulator [Paraburkholderia sp. J41]|uniref:LysR family transcriptional regulator n=1 Tax=Paraburkholderia sp. J41 TaxID=2805433 RepID=UPI002AC31774|nr:LysR family transcriptional regulator [Paraburkholderia sp. J41]